MSNVFPYSLGRLLSVKYFSFGGVYNTLTVSPAEGQYPSKMGDLGITSAGKTTVQKPSQLLPGPLSLEVVVPVRIRFISQIDLF